MTTQTAESLESRVTQFRCLELPGQPMSTHMGTSYLVNDLWSKVKEQAAEIERLRSDATVERLVDVVYKHWQDPRNHRPVEIRKDIRAALEQTK